jgi:hypothetical protein
MSTQKPSEFICRQWTSGHSSFKEKLYLAGVFLGAAIFGYAGTKQLLFWIPESIGSYGEDDNWLSLRDYIAYVFAIFAVWLAFQLEKFAEYNVWHDSYRIQLDGTMQLIEFSDQPIGSLIKKWKSKIAAGDLTQHQIAAYERLIEIAQTKVGTTVDQQVVRLDVPTESHSQLTNECVTEKGNQNSDNDDNVSWHPTLDQISDNAKTIILDFSSINEQNAIVISERWAYIACYQAAIEEGRITDGILWNTLVAAFENRILAITKRYTHSTMETDPNSGIVTLTNYVSVEFVELKNLESCINEHGVLDTRQLIKQTIPSDEVSTDITKTVESYFFQAKKTAKNHVFPVIDAF